MMIKKKNKLIIAAVLVLCMLTCSAFSYAAFSSNLSISGTAKAQGSFDVQFDTTAINKLTNKELYNKDDIIVKVSSVEKDDKNQPNDKLVLDITLPANYNSSFTFNVPVKNLGTVDAVASAIDPKEISNIKLSAAKVDLAAAGTTGDTGNIKVTLTASQAVTAGSTIKGFTLEVVYDQTKITPPTAAHAD